MNTCQSEQLYKSQPAHYRVGNTGYRMEPIDGVLYWHLGNMTEDMDKYRVIHSFEQVFQILAQYMGGIRFVASAEMVPEHFYPRFAHNGDAHLPDPFGVGTLAYAYFPPYRTGESYFNDGEQWAEMNSGRKMNLKKVAVHEFLHNLNLHHSEDVNDILYFQNTASNDINLTLDTQQGLLNIYEDLMPDLQNQVDEYAIALDALSAIFYHEKRLRRRPNMEVLENIAKRIGIAHSGRRDELIDRIETRLRA